MYPRYVSLIAFFIYFQIFVHFFNNNANLSHGINTIHLLSVDVTIFLRKNLAYYMNKSIAIEKENLKLGFFGP